MIALEYAYRWTNNIEGSWSSEFSIITLADGSQIQMVILIKMLLY